MGGGIDRTTPKELDSAEGEDPTFHSHGDGRSPCSVPHGTRGQSEPLTFSEHSISLLFPLAGPDMPQSAGEPCPLSLVLLYRRGDRAWQRGGKRALLFLSQAGTAGHKLTASVTERTPLPHVPETEQC